MTSRKYSHPEGVLIGLTAHDWVRWPLRRYGECLDIEGELDICMREADRDLRAKYGPELESWTPEGDHKYSLRWSGLRLLKEVREDDRLGGLR